MLSQSIRHLYQIDEQVAISDLILLDLVPPEAEHAGLPPGAIRANSGAAGLHETSAGHPGASQICASREAPATLAAAQSVNQPWTWNLSNETADR